MEDEELVRLERSSAKTIRKAKGWRLAAGNLMWVVLSLQAASIGQIPVFLCCLGLLLTPLLVTWILPCWFLRRVVEGSPSFLVVLISALFMGKPLRLGIISKRCRLRQERRPSGSNIGEKGNSGFGWIESHIVQQPLDWEV